MKVNSQKHKKTGAIIHNNLLSEKDDLNSELAKEKLTIISGYVKETAKIRRKFKFKVKENIHEVIIRYELTVSVVFDLIVL